MVATEMASETVASSWLGRLEERLDARQPVLRINDDYYEGRHRLQFATSKFRQTFGGLFAAFADNWTDLVVDAAVERLRVEGFRVNDQGADSAAWDVWQHNQLDAGSLLAHSEAVKHGVAYTLVEPPADGEDVARVTVEHPAQVIVAYEPGSSRVRAAALKKWLDDDGHAMATLYLPDWVLKFRSDGPVGMGGQVQWVAREDEPAVPNPLGVVPVIPLPNNPTMLGGGRSDIAAVIDLQNAINKLVTDMLIASEYGAFRQRWATGIDIPGVDPQTGEAMGAGSTERFLGAVDRVWAVENDQAKFGDFAQTDLKNFVGPIEMLIQHVAAQTRTPPHYLLGSAGSFPSGESLKATETGLVAKVKRKQLSFGEGWEETIRLAFLAVGDEERGSVKTTETIWMDPEARTEGERVDALLKMGQLGVPEEALWEKWGATPQEIERWTKIRDSQPPLPAPLPPGYRATEKFDPPGSDPIPPPGAVNPAPAGTPQG